MCNEGVDVVVVGGGVAGLAAARELRGAGKSVRVVEARSRLGGRVHSVTDRSCNVPIELGAEFIHARALDSLPRGGPVRITPTELRGESLRARGGSFEITPDFWAGLTEQVRTRNLLATPDRPFAEFLATYFRGDRWRDLRAAAIAYVEGFHAAPASNASTHGLFATEQVFDVADQQWRILEGGGALVAAMAQGLEPSIHLNAIVTRIRWEPGRVEVEARSRDGDPLGPFRGRRVLVTLPAGVLKRPPGDAGAVRFEPGLGPAAEAVRALEMGDAVKVVLRFDDRFWERIGSEAASGGSLEALGFLQAPGEPLPAWWTWHPVRAALLTGWAGGPAATRLAAQPREAVLDSALASLAHALRLRGSEIQGHLQAWHYHDWSSDPFARGAYTYLAMGGREAIEQVARPVGGTVFIAGEATGADGRHATVHGAIASGVRAARAIVDGWR